MNPDWKTGCVPETTALKLVTITDVGRPVVDIGYHDKRLKAWRRLDPFGDGRITVTAWADMPEPYRP